MELKYFFKNTLGGGNKGSAHCYLEERVIFLFCTIMSSLPVKDKYLLRILAVTCKIFKSEPPAENKWIAIVSNIQETERITFYSNIMVIHLQ